MESQPKVFEFKGYVDFVSSCLEVDRAAGRRGGVGSIAKSLSCHPTFVSQVLKGKAHFSQDQALAFCRMKRLDDEESDFFLLLLSRERAGSKETVEYFEKRIERVLESRLNLKSRWKLDSAMPNAQAIVYFSSWVLQSVHALTQLSSLKKSSSIALALGLPEDRVDDALTTLRDFGLVELVGDSWKSTKDSLHLGKDSPFVRLLHSAWREKALSTLAMGSPRGAVHYSGVMTMSAQTAVRVRERLLGTLEDCRNDVLASPSKEAHAIALDFYRMA